MKKNQPPQTLKGFRDFLPTQKRQRDWLTAKIKASFERFGFAPLETPTLEYASLLTGKYGDEADKLLYLFEDKGKRQVGLRYDQTVPTARVLSQYRNDLPRYFRRYQIQNVFRADKPQLGRFREFTQCDCDIFGSTSPLSDAEILAVYYDVYKSLGIKSIQLMINDRQTLTQTLSPFATSKVDVSFIIQSIDKLDKLSPEKVAKGLVAKGINKEDAFKIFDAIEKCEMSSNLREIVDKTTSLGVPRDAMVFQPKLARGLDYYTGIIFEGMIPEYTVGSVGGGGRYDNLIEDLSGLSMPAVGFGLGFDRTLEAAQQLDCLPKDINNTQILVSIFDESYQAKSLETARDLRKNGIRTELYPAVDKLNKQFKLADQKNIPWVVVVGEKETAQNKVSLKNMTTGEQQLLSLDEAIEKLN